MKLHQRAKRCAEFIQPTNMRHTIQQHRIFYKLNEKQLRYFMLKRSHSCDKRVIFFVWKLNLFMHSSGDDVYNEWATHVHDGSDERGSRRNWRQQRQQQTESVNSNIMQCNCNNDH